MSKSELGGGEEEKSFLPYFPSSKCFVPIVKFLFNWKLWAGRGGKGEENRYKLLIFLPSSFTIDDGEEGRAEDAFLASSLKHSVAPLFLLSRGILGISLSCLLETSVKECLGFSHFTFNNLIFTFIADSHSLMVEKMFFRLGNWFLKWKAIQKQWTRSNSEWESSKASVRDHKTLYSLEAFWLLLAQWLVWMLPVVVNRKTRKLATQKTSPHPTLIDDLARGILKVIQVKVEVDLFTCVRFISLQSGGIHRPLALTLFCQISSHFSEIFSSSGFTNCVWQMFVDDDLKVMTLGNVNQAKKLDRRWWRKAKHIKTDWES